MNLIAANKQDVSESLSKRTCTNLQKNVKRQVTL